MLTVNDALTRILSHVDQLPPEIIPAGEALGRVLAEDVRATHNVPPFDNSAMDGYAVRAEDVLNASREQPIELRTLEDIPAGASPRETIRPGTASRIMTGAPLPQGADAIVPVEDTDEEWQAKGRDQLPLPQKVSFFASTAPSLKYVCP